MMLHHSVDMTPELENKHMACIKVETSLLAQDLWPGNVCGCEPSSRALRAAGLGIRYGQVIDLWDRAPFMLVNPLALCL